MSLDRAEPFPALEADTDVDGMAVVPQGTAIANGRTAGVTSSNLSAVPPMQDTLSRPSSASWIHAKQAQESAIITAVRRQLEALDDKLSGQIAREIARVQQQGDRAREAAVAGVHSKIASVEAMQPKFDRKLAELSGNAKGLSEEMQAQIRRIDQMDSRLWEWRHQLDEDVRAKLSEIEQNYQQVCTSVRVTKATNDDVLKRYTTRLVRLEELLEERAAHAEDLGQSVMNLHGRLLQVEDPTSGAVVKRERPPQPQLSEDKVGTGALSMLEKHQVDFTQKLEHLQQESSDLRVLVESQEERLKSLRTLCDAQDEQYRALGDRMERENWEGRLKNLHGRVHDCEQHRIGHAEQIEILHQKIALQEHGLSQPVHSRRLQEQVVVAPESPESRFSANRLEQAEARIGALGDELEAIRTDLELAPRVAALVAALKDVAPKVITQEATVEELQRRLGEVAQGHARLETEIQRLATGEAGAREVLQ